MGLSIDIEHANHRSVNGDAIHIHDQQITGRVRIDRYGNIRIGRIDTGCLRFNGDGEFTWMEFEFKLIDGAEPVASDGNPGTEGTLILEAAFGGAQGSAFVHPGFYLIDAWGMPYRYVRGDEDPETVNKTTFDLWSEGGKRSGEEDEDQWITNW